VGPSVDATRFGKVNLIRGVPGSVPVWDTRSFLFLFLNSEKLYLEEEGVEDKDIPARLSDESQRRIADQAKKKSRHFVKGPIPIPWLAKAAKMPGKTLAVSLLLWFQGGMTGYERIRLAPTHLKRFGIDRKAVYRALRMLESERLIEATRAPGKRPIIKIVREQLEPEE
jgi:hypothetical protein